MNFGLGVPSSPTLNFNAFGQTAVVPRYGQLLCGTVSQGRNGLYYDHWFVSSSQFYHLWLMLFDPQNPALKGPKLEQIAELNTRRIWNLYGAHGTNFNYIHRVYETPAMISSNYYEILANFCFRQSFINHIRFLISEREKRNLLHKRLSAEAQQSNLKISYISIPISFEEKIYNLLQSPPEKSIAKPQTKVITIKPRQSKQQTYQPIPQKLQPVSQRSQKAKGSKTSRGYEKPQTSQRTTPRKVITIIPKKQRFPSEQESFEGEFPALH